MSGRLTREQALQRLVEDVLIGPASARRTRRRLVPGRLGAERRAAAGADERGAGRPAHPPAAVAARQRAPQRRRRQPRRSGSGRSPTSTCPAASELPRGAWRVAAVVEGGFAAREGRRRGALRARSRPSRASSAGEHDAAFIPARPRAPTAGCVGELHPALLEGDWGAFELDLATLFAGVARARAVRGRHHVPGPEAGPRVRRRRGRSGRALVEAAREAAGAELREMRAFDVYRGAAGRRGPQVGRVRRRVPVARAHAHRRGRRRACANGSSRRSPSVSAPNCAPRATAVPSFEGSAEPLNPPSRDYPGPPGAPTTLLGCCGARWPPPGCARALSNAQKGENMGLRRLLLLAVLATMGTLVLAPNALAWTFSASGSVKCDRRRASTSITWTLDNRAEPETLTVRESDRSGCRSGREHRRQVGDRHVHREARGDDARAASR